MSGSEDSYSPSTPSPPLSPNPSRVRPSPSIITSSPSPTPQSKRSRSISQQNLIPNLKKPKRSLADHNHKGSNAITADKFENKDNDGDVDHGIHARSNNSKRNERVNPSLHSVISHLATPLQPLVSVTTGLPHPEFPMSLLQYRVLTTDQLDSLAEHYHQFYPPVPEAYAYPLLIKPWIGLDKVDIEVKRGRFGKFIGLGGCESPISAGPGVEMGAGAGAEAESDEQMLERMEREWFRALGRARQEEGERAIRRKWGFQ